MQLTQPDHVSSHERARRFPSSKARVTEMDKPTLRGVLHHLGAPCALGAGLVLAAMAPTWRATAAR
jgi:hypothetical protein